MRLLLDSHVVLWTGIGGGRLSAAARVAVCDSKNERFVSPISVYELEAKRASGRLIYPAPSNWSEALTSAGFAIAQLSLAAASQAAALPRLHGDPWDRLLVAQALVDRLTLVTADAQLSAYGVTTLW